MRYLLDEDVDPAAAEAARALNLDVVSVHELGRCGVDFRDDVQLRFAASEQRIMVTRNRDDYIRLTRTFFQAGEPHCGVLIAPYILPNEHPGRIARALKSWHDGRRAARRLERRDGVTMSDLLDDILETWEINNEINLFILRWIPPEGLEAVTLLKTGRPSRGRNVARNFAHVHEVRCSKLDRNLAEGVDAIPRFEGSESPDAGQLSRALARSGDGVASVVRAAVEEDGGLKGWKRSPVAWLAYLISHESHHRGQIAQALKQSGVRPPQEVSYGIWGYWGGYALKEPE